MVEKRTISDQGSAGATPTTPRPLDRWLGNMVRFKDKARQGRDVWINADHVHEVFAYSALASTITAATVIQGAFGTLYVDDSPESVIKLLYVAQGRTPGVADTLLGGILKAVGDSKPPAPLKAGG